MKSYRHLPGNRKSTRRKSETSKQLSLSPRPGSQRFQMETLESRVLLSDTASPMIALDLLDAVSGFSEPAIVLVMDQSLSANGSETSSDSPVSKEGQLLDIAYSPAAGEIFLASNHDITRLDAATQAVLGSFDIPGSDFTTSLGLQILSGDVASLGGTAVEAGSLLVANGTSASASIFAIDSITGSVKASLVLGEEFDVVAGAFDAGRGTLFLLDASNDRIVELNAADPAGHIAAGAGVSATGFDSDLPVRNSARALRSSADRPLAIVIIEPVSIAARTRSAGIERNASRAGARLAPVS